MEVNTEYGPALVIEAKPAAKTYKCPLCDDCIEVEEKHKVLMPVEISYTFRRHVHSKCLELFIQNNLTIRLHPNSREGY
jgi:hypothetical protein